MEPTKVTLGRHEVPVYPQTHAYLTNKLGKWMGALSQGVTEDGSTEQMLLFLRDNAYELLTLLIPAYGKRVPRFEFEGYASAEAQAAGDYDEEDDPAPTFPEIVHAFETAVKVNRFDIFTHLKSIVDPQLLRTSVNAALAERLTSIASPNSPSPNGESVPMSSGTTPQTSMASEDGPSGD